MKKQLISGTAVAAVAAAISPAEAAPPVPLYNWTGFYAGANAGYSWGLGQLNYSDSGWSDFGGGLPGSISGAKRLDGAIGGLQIGYNWQINNAWVWGLETDFQLSSEKASHTSSLPYNDGEFFGTVTATLNSKIMWFGTVRARVGFLVTPTTLVYGTGGFAYGRVNASGSFFDNCCNIMWSFNESAINIGYAAGGGIEGAFPTIPGWNTKNWTWKFEYLYIDLGHLNGTGFDPDFGGVYNWNVHFTDNIVRFGINYRLP